MPEDVFDDTLLENLAPDAYQEAILGIKEKFAESSYDGGRLHRRLLEEAFKKENARPPSPLTFAHSPDTSDHYHSNKSTPDALSSRSPSSGYSDMPLVALPNDGRVAHRSFYVQDSRPVSASSF